MHEKVSFMTFSVMLDVRYLVPEKWQEVLGKYFLNERINDSSIKEKSRGEP